MHCITGAVSTAHLVSRSYLPHEDLALILIHRLLVHTLTFWASRNSQTSSVCIQTQSIFLWHLLLIVQTKAHVCERTRGSKALLKAHQLWWCNITFHAVIWVSKLHQYLSKSVSTMYTHPLNSQTEFFLAKLDLVRIAKHKHLTPIMGS